MDEDRLKHSYAVANKMIEIAKKQRLASQDIEACFVIGLNHDIGYNFKEEGKEHNVIGGEILRRMGFEYWKDIYYHGEIDIDYDSIFLDILNQADMQIDKYGNDVGYEKRLEDIKSRYGEDSNIYIKCCKLVESFK